MSRFHPVLKKRMPHYGVDYGAPVGTPVLVTADGTVTLAGRNGGGGNMVTVRHTNGYETNYLHLSRFGKGIRRGARVVQGQVIGYVGSTGLSTGPHLHYEVIVNGRKVDPMRIRVPRGRTLQGRMLATFQREKARIERLMKKPHAAPRIASAAASYRLASAR
jgi:murein DD-endopeptidase MepM/ murein hydrolase activator NlpD